MIIDRLYAAVFWRSTSDKEEAQKILQSIGHGQQKGWKQERTSETSPCPTQNVPMPYPCPILKKVVCTG